MEMNNIGMIVQSLSDPEVRRRLDTLRELLISIGKRKGWVHDEMTREQALEAVFIRFRKMRAKRETDQAIHSLGKVDEVEIAEPIQKEIRVRLPQDKWCQIGEEARKLHVSHAQLAGRWILEGLSACMQDEATGLSAAVRIGLSPKHSD